MHRALFISEILLEIFRYLHPSSRGRPACQISTSVPSWPGGGVFADIDQWVGWASLVALARTCKTFYEPAMDLIWANMVGIEPFLGCVARLHPMYFDCEGIEPLSGDEARQFMRHAARVRSMCIPFYEHLHLLNILPTETCLFPRLTSLTWEVPRSDTINFHLFLSPTLRHCSISALHPSMQSIGTRCAALEHLAIKASHRSTADERSLLARTVRSCKQLQYLDCAPLDWATWNHLSNVHPLLSVRIRDNGCLPLDRSDLKFAPFLNIVTLQLYVETAAYPIAVIRHLEFPSLIEFEMHVNILPWADAEELFRTLSQCKSFRQTLKDIAIFSSDDAAQEPSCNSLTAIRQFLCFPQLQTLWLSCDNCPIYLDNDLLLEAISSWPHIRQLQLGSNPDLYPPPVVTFRGLFAALRLCPQLETLRILIDVDDIDIDPEAESYQHTSLTSLNLCLSHHEDADAEAVARIIFFMLPGIEQVGLGADWEDGWHEVNRHLECLKSSAAHGQRII
ncbi:uncharacterized protein EDB91DRAFT_189270 [Suillus paluster]|uniref:uncharacterized protein n=1 Tax=Suillus paluster TaxID=48578 RepID=UPI001B8761AE|nr:uncharacterized protein EDB91DRAFT_189270 [Suillus paluster]KAG1744544.1 hypothetical protein EDB91DRAFT_189270 [Suillus paluster]